MAATRLSTFDNPFNPFTDWYEWWVYDITHGWNSCELLDRVAKTSDLFSDYENEDEINRAIDEIIACDPVGIRCRVIEGKPLPKAPDWLMKALTNANDSDDYEDESANESEANESESSSDE